jgi:hypothetical protein
MPRFVEAILVLGGGALFWIAVGVIRDGRRRRSRHRRQYISNEAKTKRIGSGIVLYRKMQLPTFLYRNRSTHSERICVICHGEACDPHHLEYSSRSSSDRYHNYKPCVWVCRLCHNEITELHRRPASWRRSRLDPLQATYVVWKKHRKARQQRPDETIAALVEPAVVSDTERR